MNSKFPVEFRNQLDHFQWVRHKGSLGGERIPTAEADGIKNRFLSDVATLTALDDNPRFDKASEQPGVVELTPAGLRHWQAHGETVLEGSDSLTAQFNPERSEVSIQESNQSEQVYTHATIGDSLDLFEGIISGEERTYSSYILSTSFNLENHAELGPQAQAKRRAERAANEPLRKPYLAPSPESVPKQRPAKGQNWLRTLTGFSGSDRLEALEREYGSMPFHVRMMAQTDSTSDELASVVQRVLRERGDSRVVDSYDEVFYR